MQTVIPKNIHVGLALPTEVFNEMRFAGEKNYSQGIVERRYLRSEIPGKEQ